VLCGDARIEETAGLNLPVDVRADVSAFKENLLSEVLRMELGLNELGFKPANEVRKALNSFDVGCDKLRNHAVAVAGRELETNRRQLRKLFQYLLPDGQPQQEVVSLLHFLDFYGLDFLDGLRDVLQADDLRHQVVCVAPEASVWTCYRGTCDTMVHVQTARGVWRPPGLGRFFAHWRAEFRFQTWGFQPLSVISSASNQEMALDTRMRGA